MTNLANHSFRYPMFEMILESAQPSELDTIFEQLIDELWTHLPPEARYLFHFDAVTAAEALEPAGLS